jgi:hypothetical protein
MKAFARCGVVIVCVVFAGCAAMRTATSAETTEQAALALVNKRMAAYNAHDIEAFLATYAPKVRIYIYPERFLGEGRERMRRLFGPQFARGDGKVVVLDQHVVDDKVVNVEDVTIADSRERNISIYTIKDGAIAEVRLIEPGE